MGLEALRFLRQAAVLFLSPAFVFISIGRLRVRECSWLQSDNRAHLGNARDSNSQRKSSASELTHLRQEMASKARPGRLSAAGPRQSRRRHETPFRSSNQAG